MDHLGPGLQPLPGTALAAPDHGRLTPAESGVRLGLSGEGPRDIPFIGIAESKDSEWTAADLDEFLAQTWADEIYRDAFNRDP
jgi:hypothetical protein